jgi:hypothetical protein
MSASLHAEPQEARAATRADTPAISQALARAFHDDPIMCHFLPDEATRPEKMPRIFSLLFRLALPYGGCDVTEGCEAAAIWRPPARWHIPLWRYLVHAGELLGIFGTDTFGVMSAMETVEKAHPKVPHWYLQVIGTDTKKQGKGYGGRVMRHRLARIDAMQMPAYLESSKDSNIPIYQSFGFELRREIRIANGPTLYPMWRDPR